MLNWPIVVDGASRDILIDRLLERRARVQLVQGEGGIGKTTLAAAVASGLAERGMALLPVVAMHELSGIPLAAMAPALATASGAEAKPIADRVQDLFAHVASDPARHVLVVDDAHLLDEVSASTIYQLVRVSGVRCLFTARTASDLPGPIAQLLDDGLVDIVAVDGLGTAAAGRLVESALDGPVEPDSLRRLVNAAAGNPLFLRELLAASVEGNAITASPRGLHLDQTPLPTKLRDSIAQRFAGLSTPERTLAELIAVAQPWSESALGEQELLHDLAELGLVTRSDDDLIRLSHPLFAEVLMAGLPPADLDARRIEAAARSAGDADDAVRFKVDVLLAETSAPPLPEELTWAARYAYSVTDHALALRLAGLALARVRSFDALLVRASALSAIKSGEALDALADTDAAARSDYERALIAREWARYDAITRARPADAIQRDAAALASLQDPSARRLLEDDIAGWRLITGEGPFVEPRPDAEDGGAGPLELLSSIAYEVAYAAQTSDFARARAAIERARPLSDLERLASPTASSILDLYEFRVICFEQGFGPAQSYVEQHRRASGVDEVGMWSNCLALIALYAGRVTEALDLATEAVEQLNWRDVSGALAGARAVRAAAAAQLGMRPLAREYLDSEPSGDMKEMRQRAEVLAWLSSDDPAAAAEFVVQAGERAIAAHAHALAAPTVYLAVRLGHAARALPTLRVIGGTAQSPLIGAMLAHAEASVAADPNALMDAASRLAELGVTVGAVDAAFEASQLYRKAGRGEPERKALLFIAAHGAGLSGYRRDRRQRGTFELSEREWAVAKAAGGRERSREIAERLGLSTRTVENHLARIYRKLGVAGRDELRRELELLADSE